MERYLAGEGNFSALYDALAPRLYWYFVHHRCDPAQSEDLVQQTMLQLHCKRHLFVRGAPATPWAFTIARHLLIDHIRQNQCERARNQILKRSDPEAELGTDDVLHAKRVARLIERELARLPAEKRIVVQMLKKDGLSIRQVADVLGVSPNAVKLRASRACAALRASPRLSEITRAELT